MKLSIIILNFNTSNITKQCIESIPNFKFKYEIILIDNHSSDNISQLEYSHKNLNFIKMKENTMFARGNNIGFSKSQGEYIMLLGSDTKIIGDAVEQLIHFLDTNKEYNIVAPQLLNQDGSIQPSCRSLPTLWNIIADRLGISNEYKLKNWNHDNSQEVEQPQATCILIRRKIIEKYGLFDERFPLYFNDVDFFKKMKLNKIKTFFLSNAKVSHLYGASTKKIVIKVKILLLKEIISKMGIVLTIKYI